MVLDVQRPQPALLPHGGRDEVAQLDQLRLAEVAVQALPEGVVGGKVPGDRLGVRERRLLPFAVALRLLEIEQLAVVLLDEAGAGGLHRPLVSAVLAFDRPGDVHAAQFLEIVVGHPVLEDVPPGVGK